jgi:outer membrane protein OmpA-like peptidoglycan-associated protein
MAHLRSVKHDVGGYDRAGADRARASAWLWAVVLLGLGLLALWVFTRESAEPRAAGANACSETTLTFVQNAVALTSGSQGALTRTASCLNGDRTRGVRLVGRASLEEPASLGQARAEAAARMLAARGVERTQMRVEVGRQVCPQSTPACERQNRSVTVMPVAATAD